MFRLQTCLKPSQVLCYLSANSKGSCKTALMRRLAWAFAGRHVISILFSCAGSFHRITALSTYIFQNYWKYLLRINHPIRTYIKERSAEDFMRGIFDDIISPIFLCPSHLKNGGKGILCYPRPSVCLSVSICVPDGVSSLLSSFSGGGIRVLWKHFYFFLIFFIKAFGVVLIWITLTWWGCSNEYSQNYCQGNSNEYPQHYAFKKKQHYALKKK